MPHPLWKSLSVRLASDVATLDEPLRSAALYRWYNGDASVLVRDPQGPQTNPRAIDWTDFPAHEALGDQRGLASLARSRSVAPAPPAPSTPALPLPDSEPPVRVPPDSLTDAEPFVRTPRKTRRSGSTLDRGR